jgi:cytochrome P450
VSNVAVDLKRSPSAIPGVDPANIVELDPGSAEFKANAHRHMAEWARRPPFYAVTPGQLPQVIVGRYHDARQVFSDTVTFASEMPRGPGWEQFNKIMDAQFVTQMDGEQHGRVRRLLMPAFSSRRITQLEEGIGKVVDRLLDGIAANGPEFDAMDDYGDDRHGRAPQSGVRRVSRSHSRHHVCEAG